MTGLGVIILVLGAWIAGNQNFRTSSHTLNQNLSISNATSSMGTLSLTSPAFENNASIPSKYTCDEDRTVSPPLDIAGVPESTKSLALIMDDPDVPKVRKPDGVFDHWIVFNLPAGRQALRIEEGRVPDGAVVGANGAGQNAYTGPCPPKEYEPSEHRYFFKLYGLDTVLDLPTGASKKDVENAMQGHVIEQAQLIGKYKRK